MRWIRQRRRRVLALALAGAGSALVVVWLVWAQALPWAANHYGFALPGTGGLPYRIHYAGRSYATNGMCARASWCAGQQSDCEASADVQRELQTHGQWPLREVGRVRTLPLGPSYPMLAATIPGGMTTMVLYVPYQGCYQIYGLEGGP